MSDDPRVWNAKWIAYAYDPREDIGVFGFRRRLDLDRVPESLSVRVSADNRYKLYVNGEFVGFGPQRGDPAHWFYETYDLAPFLKVGENWIAALVWNFGRWAPMAQMSARTGFVVDCGGRISDFGMDPEGADTDHSDSAIRNPQSEISTPDGWQVARLDNWSFDMMHSHEPNHYIDVGPGEVIDFRGAPWGWRTGQETPLPPSSKGVVWREPHIVCRAEERGAGGGGSPWMLVPRSIPVMRYERRSSSPVGARGFLGDKGVPDDEVAGLVSGEPLWNDNLDMGDENVDYVLRPDRPLLLDYGELVTAYPRLRVRGPVGATITLTYAEALWHSDGSKGNRDEVVGKEVRGYQDKLILDGETRTIETLWWRTFRYLLIAVDSPNSLEQGDHSTPGGVLLRRIDAIETGYPLEAESSFEADDPWVEKIWDVSLRTARRCAGETYFDCPYWEQLQYVGDTRIQALIGYYLGRDRALQRNAVETLGWSLVENGLTQSRYPARQVQIIPPFSLWWVMMVYDQLLYDGLPANVDVSYHDTTREIIAHWVPTLTGAVRDQFWQFADWVPGWRAGVPPGGALSTVNVFTGLLASLANDLIGTWITESIRGNAVDRGVASIRSPNQLSVGDVSNGLRKFSGDPNWQPSEHAEALARILPMQLGDGANTWPVDSLAKANAAKCTYYFSYYKHLAMFGRPAGEWQGDLSHEPGMRHHAYPFDYMAELAPWKQMIEDGLTTFAENPEPTRSDCHAWSAHPLLGFFQIVAGVTSIAPGWKKARIIPHPGSLKRFDARIAHPDGELRVRFEGGRLQIDSPVPFELRWQDRTESFPSGKVEA